MENFGFPLRTLLSIPNTVKEISVDNIKSVSESINTITHKIEEGEGTLGKLWKDDTLYNSMTSIAQEAEKSFDYVGRLRTYLDFSTEYNTGDDEWKGYFNLTLRPDKDKYYILGVVSDPLGSVETTVTKINGETFTEEKVKRRVEFTAQFAKRYEDLALRIGLMENTFGVGTDYFFHNEKGRVKLDVWDFGADEVNADNAHLKRGVDYKLFK